MKWFITGGAGFIGSHFVDHLLNNSDAEKVTVFDNFSNAREWHLENHINNPKFEIIKGSVETTYFLAKSMENHDVVLHLASNADIAKATTNPSVDFWQGTALSNSVAEAMRISGVKKLLFASGSGVYGDVGEVECREDQGNLLPISPYGCSKLSSELLFYTYSYMFNLNVSVFRFANVVGGRQTHGVSLDFTRKLLNNSAKLDILGNGTQSKSYIHVNDVISAVLLANQKQTTPYEIYNIATEDYITVEQIANLVINCLNLSDVKLNFGTEDRGWKGDVPVIRLNTEKIKNLGWTCQKSTYQALMAAVEEMLPDFKLGRL